MQILKAALLGVLALAATAAGPVGLIELPVDCSAVQRSGDLWWVEVDFDTSSLPLPDDTAKLAHCQFWLEAGLRRVGEGLAQVDVRPLKAGEEIVALASLPESLAVGLGKATVRESRTYRLDLTAPVLGGASEGQTAFRIALGRFDPGGWGEVELSDPSELPGVLTCALIQE